MRKDSLTEVEPIRILELIDLYEDYTNPGHAAPIITTEDGKVSDNEGYRPYVAYRHLIRRRKSCKHKDALPFFACITYPEQCVEREEDCNPVGG